MPLSYLRDDYHKQVVTHIRESQRFKSMYTLQGKTWPTRHTLSMLSPRMVQDHMYLTRSMHSNPSRVTDNVGQSRLTDPWLRIQLLSQANQWSTPTDQSMGPYPVSLPSQPMKQWRKANIYRQPDTKLAGPINTIMRSVRSILARGGQPIDP
jgi:hypothetical protein